MEKQPIGKSSKMSVRFTILCGFIVLCLGVLAFALCNRPDHSDHVYLLSDGSYAMNTPTRTCLTAQQVGMHFENLEVWPGRIQLNIAPNRTLDELIPLLEQTATLGFAKYQMRVGEEWINFQIPGCMGCREVITSPSLIDLRDNKFAPHESEAHSSVLVLADGTLTCHDLIQSLRSQAVDTSTAEILVSNVSNMQQVFFCSPNHDRPRASYRNPHLPGTMIQRLSVKFYEVRNWVGF